MRLNSISGTDRSIIDVIMMIMVLHVLVLAFGSYITLPRCFLVDTDNFLSKFMKLGFDFVMIFLFLSYLLCIFGSGCLVFLNASFIDVLVILCGLLSLSLSLEISQSQCFFFVLNASCLDELLWVWILVS